MATPDSFVGTWGRDDWTPHSPKYDHLFPKVCVLTFAPSDAEPTYRLTWTDGNEIPHTFHFDPHDQQEGQLISRAEELEGYLCTVTLLAPKPPDGTLEGRIDLASETGRLGEGPVGTFTAHADNRKEDLDATRLEESIAV